MKMLRSILRDFKRLPVFIVDLIKEFINKGCQRNAAALTYMTLFALVPMMTVTYSMFSLVPAFDGVAEHLQALIFEHFLPSSSINLAGYLSEFSSQARSLTGFGVAMLIVTAYLMLTNIEKTFNMIWGVKQARRGLSSFLLYWAVLSIGPLLLGMGMVLSTYLLSIKIMVEQYDQLGVIALVFRYASFLMTSTAFTLLFAAVPNCRVPFKHALLGGLVTALCFELLKFGFGNMVANSSISLIYGAFAVAPLFLIWINCLWMIVLGGAVFVRSLSENRYGRYQNYSDMQAMLSCLQVFEKKAKKGESVRDDECISVGVSLFRWQNLRSILVKNRWIVVTEIGEYALIRDLHETTLWDLAVLVEMPIGESTSEFDLDQLNALHDMQTDEESKEGSSYSERSRNILASSQSWFSVFKERTENANVYTHDQFDISLYSLFSGSGYPATHAK